MPQSSIVLFYMGLQQGRGKQYTCLEKNVFDAVSKDQSGTIGRSLC